jgi:hypothetical protein
MAKDTVPVSNTEPPNSEEFRRFEMIRRGLFSVAKTELDTQVKMTALAKAKVANKT